MSRYAVNLADLTACRDDPLVGLLLLPTLTRRVVQAEPDRVDGMAVEVQPEISAERWRAIVEILRGSGGLPATGLQVYERATGEWPVIREVPGL